MKYWIVKQEPESYSWNDFVKEGGTKWTGVRNYQARNFLKGMAEGDQVFFYHSGDEKQVVGLARVKRAAYADPTATEGDWVAVDLTPNKPLPNPVTLAQIKADAVTKELLLVRNSRLSVSPLAKAQFARVLELSKQSPAKR